MRLVMQVQVQLPPTKAVSKATQYHSLWLANCVAHTCMQQQHVQRDRPKLDDNGRMPHFGCGAVVI